MCSYTRYYVAEIYIINIIRAYAYGENQERSDLLKVNILAFVVLENLLTLRFLGRLHIGGVAFRSEHVETEHTHHNSHYAYSETKHNKEADKQQGK